MPAEWERHEGTWLTWPHNRITWPGAMLAQVERIYARMITALLQGERVHLVVGGPEHVRKVQRLLPRTARTHRLIYHHARAVDTWIRDYGPIFVKKGPEVAFTKWIFNAWGGKYSDLARDNGVVDRLSALRDHRRWDPGIVLEGGSIDMDGQGTCLTTEQCLLNRNRNPRLDRRSLETYLKRYLGVRKVIWLKEGIEGDDTDGHVDDITRFTAPRTVVTAVEHDRSDRNHELLDENLLLLRKATDAQGRRLRIVELPMPGRVGPARDDSPHDRLPASYANFYIGNAAVLLPVYSHANDGKAVKIMKSLFKDRKIVPIECTPLVYGLGSIHCVSQQQPL
ncbi:MAG: putative agmatine deiminase [Candidatus Omnitrophica bacterium]|nr:putative agmatine deiminase [Candidatus Omnitrophota bacterium]